MGLPQRLIERAKQHASDLSRTGQHSEEEDERIEALKRRKAAFRVRVLLSLCSFIKRPFQRKARCKVQEPLTWSLLGSDLRDPESHGRRE